MRYRQSYKEKLAIVKATQIADGLVSERYAGVSSIDFHMTYYQRGHSPILMLRTLSFLPANYCSFHLRCLHDGCTDGGYDLAPVVARLAKSRKNSTTGKIYCHGTNDTIGHASIAYEVNIKYNRQVK
jgi:hypothetical protein